MTDPTMLHQTVLQRIRWVGSPNTFGLTKKLNEHWLCEISFHIELPKVYVVFGQKTAEKALKSSYFKTVSS